MQRRLRESERVDELLWALNSLGGVGGVDCQAVGGEGQRSAVLSAQRAVRRCVPPVQDSSPQEALWELLRTDARYSGGEAYGTIAPFGSGRVSLPEVAVDAPQVTSLLRGYDADYFERFRDRMLRSDVEYAAHVKDCGEAKRYVDPLLASCRGKYRDFIGDLDRRGLICWRRRVAEHVGLFFVRKKDASLRFICDARRSNARFREPPTVRLATGDSLCRLQLFPGEQLHVGSFDIRTTSIS